MADEVVVNDEDSKKDIDISLASEKEIQDKTWLDINLDEDELKIVVNKILAEIDKIEEDRAPILSQIKQYRNQYDQVVEETSMPFPGSFNLCVPATPKVVDACVSQTEEAFEDVDPKWTIQTPPDKNLIPARDLQEKTLDYYSDAEMEDTEAWQKVYHDAFLLGNGWLALPYKREYMRIRDFVEYSSIEQFQKDFPSDFLKYPKYLEDLAQGKIVKMVVEYNQEIMASPKPEHIEWEDVYVPINTNGLQGMLKSRIVARYVAMRWEEIKIEEEEKNYIKGVSEDLKYKVGNDGSPQADIDPEYMKKIFDTFEVIYFVDIDGDGIEERCLFNIEKSHKKCLRAIRYPYNHNRPYITPYCIQWTRKGIYQPGLGEKLQSLNIALNAILNHTLNASIIANSLSLKVRQGTDAVRALYEHQWYPGSVLELMNLDDVQQFTFNTPNLSSLINLFAIVERFGEDVSGIVNYALGQESQEDPQAPASKTIALMRKSEIKLRRYIKSLKKSNNEVGYQALRLIYQYVPKSRIAKIFGIAENMVTALFQYPLKAITQSSGFAIEKMFEKRDNQQMSQMLLQEPLVAQDPIRRLRLYRINAKDFGSNWDKKIELVLPSEEEVLQKQQEAKRQADEKKMNVVRQAAQAILEQGGTEEEARQAGMMASQRYDALLQQQGQNQPQGGDGNGKSQPNTQQPV